MPTRAGIESTADALGARKPRPPRGRRADVEPGGGSRCPRRVGLDPIGVDVTSRLIIFGAVVLTLGACGSGSKCCGPTTGNAVATCQGLQTSFFSALPAAQSCSTTSGGQCQKTVPLLSIGCTSICAAAVNDDSALMPIETQWNLLGCSQLLGFGCVQGCREARTGVCAAQDGGAVCDP